MINKKSLNDAIEFVSNLKLKDRDYENILERFKPTLQNPNFSEILRKILTIKEIAKESDLKTIIKKLVDNLDSEDLNILLKDIMKDDAFISFIQDLFLEKLI